MEFNYALASLKQITKWRWLLSILVLAVGVLMVLSSYASVTEDAGVSHSLLEFILRVLNDSYFLCLMVSLALIILLGDLYNQSSGTYDDLMLLKFNSRQQSFSAYIAKIILSCAIITVLILIIAILFYLMTPLNKGADNNVLMYLSFVFNGASPYIVAIISCCFVFLRLIFLCLVILCLNLVCKNPIGFLAVFAIAFIDLYLYEALSVSHTWNILPIEHTRTVLTIGIAPIDGVTRINFGFSFLYWAILIVVMALIARRIFLKKDFLLTEFKEY